MLKEKKNITYKLPHTEPQPHCVSKTALKRWKQGWGTISLSRIPGQPLSRNVLLLFWWIHSFSTSVTSRGVSFDGQLLFDNCFTEPDLLPSHCITLTSNAEEPVLKAKLLYQMSTSRTTALMLRKELKCFVSVLYPCTHALSGATAFYVLWLEIAA